MMSMTKGFGVAAELSWRQGGIIESMLNYRLKIMSGARELSFCELFRFLTSDHLSFSRSSIATQIAAIKLKSTFGATVTKYYFKRQQSAASQGIVERNLQSACCQ